MGNWTQIRVGCKISDLNAVSAVMSMVDNNLMIEDANEIDLMDTCYGELLDESMAGVCRILIYILIPEGRI